MPGMRVLSDDGAPGTITGYQSPQPGCVDVAWDGGVVTHSFDPARLTLIVDAPPTLGALLALVREAWRPTCPTPFTLDCSPELGDDSPWTLLICGDRSRLWEGSLAEVLVAALEAAPVKP